MCFLSLLRKTCRLKWCFSMFVLLLPISHSITQLSDLVSFTSGIDWKWFKFLHRVEKIPYSLPEYVVIFRSSCRTPLMHLTRESHGQGGYLQTPLKLNECLTLSGLLRINSLAPTASVKTSFYFSTIVFLFKSKQVTKNYFELTCLTKPNNCCSLYVATLT